MLQAHGTRYNFPHEPFVAFDLMTGTTRLPYQEFSHRVSPLFTMPNPLHIGGPLSVEQALELLQEGGGHGSLDPAEGAMWRVERKGKVDFLAKFVRPEKKDGSYLPELTGRPPVWNQDPANL